MQNCFQGKKNWPFAIKRIFVQFKISNYHVEAILSTHEKIEIKVRKVDALQLQRKKEI